MVILHEIRTQGRGPDATLATPLPEGELFGVEVPKGHPLLGHVRHNVDPQHGGGCYSTRFFSLIGWGHKRSAVEEAVNLVQQDGEIAEGVVFVTPRLDPDAFVAAAILGGYIPYEEFRVMGAKGWGGPAMPLIEELGRLDAGEPREGGWRPSDAPQVASVGDHPIWGVVARALTSGVPQGKVLEAVRYAIREGRLGDHLHEAQRAFAEARDALAAQVHRVEVHGPVAVGDEMPFSPGLWGLLYSQGPVGVLRTTSAPGMTGRVKYTVAVSPDVGRAKADLFVEHFRALVGEAEVGWGGGATITGSPFSGSAMGLDDVVRLASVAASAADIQGVG